MNKRKNLWGQFNDDDDDPLRPKLAPDIEAIRLRDALDALNAKHKFEPGMIVRQKPQARLYENMDEHNGLAIVVEVLSEPIIANLDKAGSSHYREALDMRVGVIIANDDQLDDFLVYYVDSQRFEPVPENELSVKIKSLDY